MTLLQPNALTSSARDRSRVLIRTRRRIAAAMLAVLLSLGVGVSGCSPLTVVSPTSTEGKPRKTVSVHRFVWRAFGTEEVKANECQENGLHFVRVNHHPWRTLAFLLTLGIWEPIEIEWVCAKDPTSDTEI